jgi:hypothetical protein
LKTFSDSPKRLFDWDMRTIDEIVRKVGIQYFAVIKDETYPIVYNCALNYYTGMPLSIPFWNKYINKLEKEIVD